MSMTWDTRQSPTIEVRAYASQVEVRRERLGHDLLDADLEHVTGLGAVDVDRAGDGVRAATRVGEPQLDDVVQRRTRLDGVVRVHHRLDRHRVAGVDHELRRLLGIEPTPLGRV